MKVSKSNKNSKFNLNFKNQTAVSENVNVISNVKAKSKLQIQI